MITHPLVRVLILAVLWSPLSLQAGDEIEDLIQRHGLRAAPEPLTANPRWAPRRVVAVVSSRFRQVLPDLDQRLRQAAGDVELVVSDGSDLPGVLTGADGMMGYCTPEVMQAAGDEFLWLHNFSAGVDRCGGLDETLIEGRIVTNSKRLMGPAIAEHAIAMLLSLSRSFPALQRAQQEARWDRSIARGIDFGELEGRTLLVVGLGGIGTEVARRAHGLGMRVTATRNSRREGPDFVAYVGLADELHKLAAEADVVVNALPLTDSTRGLFDKRFFEAVKPGALFISVGRGKSTVTDDLVAALESGQLYGAGLDVTDPEPLPEDSPLWAMDNVIITPHLSAAGPDSARRVALVALENLRRYVAGEALLNLVDLRSGY